MTKQINKRPKHRTDNRSRMITVGVIVIGALLIAFALISAIPNLKLERPKVSIQVSF